MVTLPTAAKLLGNSYSLSVDLGDLDNDGDLDAFVTNVNQGDKVWLNNGSGTFTDSGQSIGTNAARRVALGDVDGDGDLDAFAADAGSIDSVWLNDGSGTFSLGQTLAGPDNSKGVGLGDLDGDGDLDAFVASNFNQATQQNGGPNKVWLNSTGSALPPPQTSPLISGNGLIGDLDPFNEVSVDGGVTWQPAHIVAKNSAWAIIPGTQYIFCGPTISDPCGVANLPGISTLYRTTFTLPSGFSNPSLTVDVHADNAAIVYLNGVEIGRHPCHQLHPTPSCTGGEFSGPPDTFATSLSSLFKVGQNILSFDLWDFGGIAGLDYEATVTY